jgi:hypothetical protein
VFDSDLEIWNPAKPTKWTAARGCGTGICIFPPKRVRMDIY